jgi:SAM-dependent methyltransferase
MDLRLLARLKRVEWREVQRALDLGCGTGRVGAWLRRAGVGRIDGVDLTPAMLAQAEAKRVYEQLVVGDMSATGLEAGVYDLVVEVLADEHVAEVGALYCEAGRLAPAAGQFVVVGYHSHFLMLGIPTHFDRSPGDGVAIECHVHLMSDHVRAAHAAGFRLVEMEEGLVDDAWIAVKPRWAAYRHHPVSFAMVWVKSAPSA